MLTEAQIRLNKRLLTEVREQLRPPVSPMEAMEQYRRLKRERLEASRAKRKGKRKERPEQNCLPGGGDASAVCEGERACR